MSVNYVAVMAKCPELSKVKTRLAKTIGDIKALEVYKLLLTNLIENCVPSECNSYRLGCFLTPQNLIPAFKETYNSLAFYSQQSDGDLGKRMGNAFEYLFEELQADKAILTGADIPNLNGDIIEQACKNLDTYDIVLGPTNDGGYYLIGMNKVHSELFENISWGTSSVLDTTLLICKKSSLRVKLFEVLSDLDIEEDLLLFPQIMKKMQ